MRSFAKRRELLKKHPGLPGFHQPDTNDWMLTTNQEFGAIHHTLFIYHPLPGKSGLINKDPRAFLDSA